MKLYSAHVKADAEPVLVREGFSWGALCFGPVWLAIHRAWVPAGLSFAASVLIAILTPAPACFVLLIGLAVILGLTGNDLVSWTIEQRGYLLTHILGGRGEEDALGRLLTHRPDLAARFRPHEPLGNP